MKILKWFISLISFLTVYPTPGASRSIYDASEAFHLAPLAGVLRGMPVFLALYLLAPSHSQALLSGVLVALHMIVQGFLHIDGLVDFGEALLAHRFGRNPGEVIKDRHRGSYGIAVMATYVVMLYSSALSIEPKTLAVIAIVGESLHGAAMVVTLWAGRAEPYSGLGRVFRERLSTPRVVASIAMAASIHYILLYIAALPLNHYPLALGILSPLIVSIIANRTLGYANGDVAGFSGEICYLSYMLAWALT
jgi:adenosylcobinamide-GDP ribazoletransferase